MERHGAPAAAIGVLPDVSAGRTVGLVLLAWVAFLAVDVLFHAGLLARIYAGGQPALLDAETAFRRIPLGYLAFLLLTGLLFWLMRRAAVFGSRAGARFGLAVGAGLGAVQALALYSILRLGAGLLLGWGLAEATELAAAGAVLGAGNAGASARRLALAVMLLLLAAIVVTIALQATGFSPPMRRAEGGAP
ncbi:MAG: hypothetical protein JW876_10935 [Candidatus Krumholzibacteriota bacterium]|nr:hypothetical protein [Candidatus Krumholzibacteriota bacterium]